MLTAQEFGTTSSGEQVTLFHLTNAAGAEVELLSYGCILRAVRVPDGRGGLANVCAGFDTLAEYENGASYMGAIVGRTSGRVENARFPLNGRTYYLNPNDGKNQLHGGPGGFSSRVWKWRVRGDSLVFYRRSPDGEEGYPGNLDVEISYELTDDCRLSIDYRALTDADTYCSLTSHAYWRPGCGVDDARLQIFSDSYVEYGPEVLPTGAVLPVSGTDFDFRDGAAIAGRVIDHSFPVGGEGLRRMCRLSGGDGNPILTFYSTLPTIHVYTGDGLPSPRSALALEAQFVPNGMNCPAFPAPLLRAGEVWAHQTVIKF